MSFIVRLSTNKHVPLFLDTTKLTLQMFNHDPNIRHAFNIHDDQHPTYVIMLYKCGIGAIYLHWIFDNISVLVNFSLFDNFTAGYMGVASLANWICCPVFWES